MEQEIAIVRKCLQENEEVAPFERILNDTFLANFIRTKKGNLEVALECLIRYIQMKKSLYPKILWDDFPADCVKFYNNGTFRLLKNKDKLGRGIVIFDVGKWGPDLSQPFEEWCQHLTAMADYLMMRTDFHSTKGIVNIIDCRNYGMQHIRLCTPTFMKNILKVSFTYPARIKAVHMLMSNPLLKATLIFLSKLLPTKISKRVHIHNNTKSLHASLDLSPDYLPDTIGGRLTGNEAHDLSFPQGVLDCAEFRHEFYRIWKENFGSELNSEYES